ncbi:nitroreductase [Variovorax sp. M-6]|uniref:nitroreductase n=1 Tax=Variovorax sp. M-6 TaxID=3233041 RepID=UPI003F95CFC5
MDDPTQTPAAVLRRLLGQRHSCRAFRPHSVPDPVVDSILETAQRTASWCNTQPWQLVMTRGEGTRRLRDALQQAARTRPPVRDIAFPSAYAGEHLARRRASGLQLYRAVGIEKEDRAASSRQALRNYDLFDAPHVLIVSIPRSLGSYALLDCGGWIANFLLAAEAHGVSAIAQAALANHCDVIRECLGLPAEEAVVCGISFGYAEREHPANGYRTSRAPLPQVLRRIDR